MVPFKNLIRYLIKLLSFY